MSIPFVPLGDLIRIAPRARTSDPEARVLSMTRSRGLVPQDGVFKKSVASRDLSKYKLVQPGQLVVGIHLDEGAIGVSKPEQTGLVSPAYVVWSIDESGRVAPEYLDRFVRSPAAVSYFSAHYRETAVRRGKVTQAQFLSLKVPLPTIEEQRRIAAVLDAADALRAKRRQALAKLDTLTQAIFIDMFGSDTSGCSSMASVVHEFRFGTSERSASTGSPALRIPNIVSGDISYDQMKRVPTSAAELERLRLRDGDVLFVRSNGNPDSVGRCAAFSEAGARVAGYGEPVVYASYLIRARLNSALLLPDFLVAYLSSPQGRQALRAQSRTSAGQYNINTKGLGSLQIPTPSLELQENFVRRASEIRMESALLEANLNRLDALFASLQHRAFRGES